MATSEAGVTATDEASTGNRLGPVELMPGVSRLNAVTKLYASGVTIAALTGMSLLQGYILTEHLEVPRRVQGTDTPDVGIPAAAIMIQDIERHLKCGSMLGRVNDNWF